MRNILHLLGWASTGQRAPLPRVAMVANDAGGYVYALDDWARLDRFLILGTEGGTYLRRRPGSRARQRKPWRGASPPMACGRSPGSSS